MLDATAILAMLNEEPGPEKITLELLSHATASALSLAEVQTKLVQESGDPEESWGLALDPLPDVEPFTFEQAKIAGSLVQKTSSLGLSLGNRACLALAIVLDAPVYTTDRPWKKLNLGIPIHVIRQIASTRPPFPKSYSSFWPQVAGLNMPNVVPAVFFPARHPRRVFKVCVSLSYHSEC